MYAKLVVAQVICMAVADGGDIPQRSAGKAMLVTAFTMKYDLAEIEQDIT